MRSLIAKAKALATERHDGQFRKHTKEPYIVHPEAVVEILKKYADPTDEMIAAAWLHDVVEDTDTSLIEIREQFGLDVALMVSALTDDEIGNRKERKEKYFSKLGMQLPKVKSIKLADMIHNAPSLILYDPKFAKVWMAEMKNAVTHHLNTGNIKLVNMATEIIENYYK